MVICLSHGTRVLRFALVAGLVARRIVCKLHEGDEVRAGQRIGLIRFGSRVDVELPDLAELQVRLGQRVVAGETVLATLAVEPAPRGESYIGVASPPADR
jgi:phosphatidylserine decarboxylase